MLGAEEIGFKPREEKRGVVRWRWRWRGRECENHGRR